MDEIKPLSPKMRLARNIHEGMDVHTVNGEWVRVVSALHITAPLQVSSFTLADGTEASAHPRQQVMCRRLPAASSRLLDGDRPT